MKVLKILPMITAALVLAACNKASTPPAASAPAGPASPTVVTINGVPVTQALLDYYAKNTAGKATGELTPEQRDQVLDSLERGIVVQQQAEKDGLDKSGDTALLLQLSRMQILEQADAEGYLKSQKPTDAELKAEYDSQVAAMPKTQYHARHILVSTQDAAQKIIDQLKKGAKFEDLAKKESIDSSKNQGGDLGWFAPSNMVKPFADAVAGLKKNEITPMPVQTQYGWHVIQLLDTRETPVPPYDQVKDRVSQIVASKKFKAYSDQLLKAATVQKS
jgi:peptidyl-prolyl cis-trans isomerase C